MINYFIENCTITENYRGSKLASIKVQPLLGYILKIKSLDEETKEEIYTYVEGYIMIPAKMIEETIPNIEAVYNYGGEANV